MTSAAEIGNLRVRVGMDSAEFSNGVQRVQGSLATLSNSLKTFATGAAAITLFNQAVDALHKVADLGDVAEAIGLTAEQVQVYSKMAEASGTSSENMMRGLQSIAEQSTDTKSKLSQLFDANGLTMAGKDMNQVILDFMNLLKAAKTPAEQLAIATGVLGDKVGRQLVESLRSGASGWNEAFNSMVKDGYYLSNEQVKAAQEIETKYNQVLSNLKSLWQGFIVDVVTGLNSIQTAYVPGSGGARSAVANRPVPGVKPAVPTTQTGDGKGDLPGNVNSGSGYSITQPTTNPFNGISQTKPPIVPEIKPGTIDDIYGAGDAVKQLQDEIVTTIPPTSELEQGFHDMAESLSSSLGTAITGLISGTMDLKDAFTSMAESISQQLEELAAQIIKSQILKVLAYMGTSIGGAQGFMGFGGLYADGGTLGSGKWGIAGEAGPEIIHGPATITPMDKIGGGSGANIQINNYVSNASVQARQQPDGRITVDFVEKELASRLARGGSPLSAGLEKGYGLKRAGR